jgi:hypothetical protein
MIMQYTVIDEVLIKSIIESIYTGCSENTGREFQISSVLILKDNILIFF